MGYYCYCNKPELGVWYPIVGQSSTEFVAGIPDGHQIGYTNGADIAQTLSDTLKAGYRYTLEIGIGGRPASLGSKPYAVIFAGQDPTPLGEVSATSPLNGWTKQTIVFTCGINDPRIGDNLTIKIVNNDAGQLDFDKVSLDEAYVITCQGFLPPFDKPLTLKKKDNRAIPVKMVLYDLFGNLITDDSIPGAPPVVQVTFGNIPPPFAGYNDELVPAGLSDDGNAFRYDQADQKWILNLATKQFTASGTYTVTVKAGDASYVIDPACSQTFTRLP